ncbi:MAG: aspartate aminotransferase family protein [Alphaproteobacteria bacterium]|nr:aspartate aminotransferase family protein [Alphaproteobacteria bacterium]
MTTALVPNYARADIAFERGEGAYLFDGSGRRYLDFASGVAVTSLGHAHPQLVAALKSAADRPWHVSNLVRIPEQERLAERLGAASFADRAFFCNSGAEAVEAALKAARRYHHLAGAPERYRVVTMQGAFHGRTLATIAAGGNPKHLDGFAPAVDGFDQVAFGNLNELRNAITPRTAAILIEPVQGEGGCRAASVEYLQGLRAAADDYGLLLIFDEVQCGFGRTGKLFAHEWAGVAPDLLAAAKGIAGGFPCGALLATEKAAAALTPGSHGSTFGGNPLAMAVANATLDVLLADGFLAGVERVAAHLRDGLARLQAQYPRLIEDVRGKGLLVGIKLSAAAAVGDFVTAARQAGLLTVPAGDNVVRLLPPLILTVAQADEGIAILERVCRAWPRV